MGQERSPRSVGRPPFILRSDREMPETRQDDDDDDGSGVCTLVEPNPLFPQKTPLDEEPPYNLSSL